jgi:hypothetical protein
LVKARAFFVSDTPPAVLIFILTRTETVSLSNSKYGTTVVEGPMCRTSRRTGRLLASDSHQ